MNKIKENKKRMKALEDRWGLPLITGQTFAAGSDRTIGVFVTFDTYDDVHICVGYGDTIEEAIDNLEENILIRLLDQCYVSHND